MKKFYSAFIGFSLLIILGTTYQIYDSYIETEKTTKIMLVSNAAIIEEAFSATLDNINNTLFNAAYDIALNQRLIEKYPIEILNRRKTPLDRISTIELRIVNNDGDIVSSTTPLDKTKKVNISDRQYFNKLKNNGSGGLEISEPIFGKLRSKWLFIAARRISDLKTNKFLGVVQASIELDFLATYKDKLNIRGDDVFAVAMGKELRFAYRYPTTSDSNMGDPFKYHPNLEPVIKNQQHSVSTVQTSKVDNKKRILAAARIGNFPIVIVIGESHLKVFKGWYIQTAIVIFFALTIIVMAFVMGLKLMKFSQTILSQQEQLVESEKFRALGELAGSIAHEINNPMTIISGNIRKLDRLSMQQPTDFIECRTPINTIKVASERIVQIIMGLKKVARNVKAETASVTIEQIVNESISYCNERITFNNIYLHISHENSQARLTVDAIQISQVFINILNNAIDAIKNGSQKWIKIETQAISKYLVIRIIDSGPGIPKHIISRIMEPFFTTKESNKGTGLGLSISKRIIESHNGKLYYDDSAANTTFVIELPLEQQS